MLKTTQSGYEGFLRDEYTGRADIAHYWHTLGTDFLPRVHPHTALPDVKDRILATSVTSTWKYTSVPPCYDAAYAAAKQAISDGFFGPARGGVFSPSVQYTLWEMGKLVLSKVPQVGWKLRFRGGRCASFFNLAEWTLLSEI